MKKRGTVLFFILLFPLMLFSQSKDFWKAPASEISPLDRLESNTTVTEYQRLDLDLNGLKKYIHQAPLRTATTSSILLDFPDSEGNMKEFEMFKTNTMSPELAAKFPSISSYIGRSRDKKNTLRLTLTDRGIYGMILGGDEGDVFINPITSTGLNYQIFSKRNAYSSNTFTCLVDETNVVHPQEAQEKGMLMPDDGKLRTYRLAMATTGEYSQFHINLAGVGGGTTAQQKAAVMTAIVTTMDRVLGIYERDLAITMTLIPNNEDIIYLNGATDPYTNNSGSTMLGENQSNINAVIGSANYDIGHVFSTGGGGIASLNSPCTANKARGVTGLPSPVTGDAFAIDYVSHEMGHQFGANHTQNNSCQRNPTTSVEPGSGSTIMGYAGICPPDVQLNSDAYFHTISISEINSNIRFGSGSTCPTETTIANTAPTITPLQSNYNIPSGTPFMLTAIATDPDGDVLTYNWEQTDTEVATMPPSPISKKGPTFRSLEPTISPTRYFPKLNVVLQGQTSSTWEVVPEIARVMNFTLTVRDNNSLGGQTATEAVTVTTKSTSPFKVTSQNTAGLSYNTGQPFQVTWDVAGTTGNGINAANVDILLSYNNGIDFTEVLASGVPNNGSYSVTAPHGKGSGISRLMVKASNNIFFDISDNFFNIQNMSVDEFSPNVFSIYPNPNNGEFTLTSDGTITGEINLVVYDIQGRIITQQSFDASGKMEKTLRLNSPQAGIYLLQISNDGKVMTKKIIVK